MTCVIRNGERVQVEIGNYVGEAGLAQTSRGYELAFISDPRTVRAAPNCIVDGRAAKLIDVARSDVVPGMVKLLIEFPEGTD